MGFQDRSLAWTLGIVEDRLRGECADRTLKDLSADPCRIICIMIVESADGTLTHFLEGSSINPGESL